MPLQVNTLVAAETADDAPAIYELLKPLGVARWSLFFLISVGRGKVLRPLTPEQGEKLMGWIFETSRASSFTVATTEAPSYRRVALERMREEGLGGDQIKRRSGVSQLWHSRRPRHHVRFEHRRHLSGRLPSVERRQRAQGSRGRHISQCAAVPIAARSRAIRGALRRMRISRALRRVTRARIRGNGQSAGGGSVLLVRAGIE